MDVTSEGLRCLDEHAGILTRMQKRTYLLEQELYEYMANISRQSAILERI
jgi:hypothetical protein